MGIDFATAAKCRREIVTAVESRIAELRRRGIEFAISGARTATSHDLTGQAATRTCTTRTCASGLPSAGRNTSTSCSNSYRTPSVHFLWAGDSLTRLSTKGLWDSHGSGRTRCPTCRLHDCPEAGSDPGFRASSWPWPTLDPPTAWATMDGIPTYQGCRIHGTLHRCQDARLTVPLAEMKAEELLDQLPVLRAAETRPAVPIALDHHEIDLHAGLFQRFGSSSLWPGGTVCPGRRA